jgi:pantetheine-phosphate adenylyltransferase
VSGRQTLLAKVLYPGSFDPFHNGHLELVGTVADLFHDPQKGEPLLTLPERIDVIAESVAGMANVAVTSFSTLVVELAEALGADMIIRGLRAPSDFESEMAQAQMNLAISGVQTLFVPSASANSYIASKYIREIVRLGGDVGSMVPDAVAKRLHEKYRT